MYDFFYKVEVRKQKVKAYYGIMERQLRRYYSIALKKEGKTDV